MKSVSAARASSSSAAARPRSRSPARRRAGLCPTARRSEGVDRPPCCLQELTRAGGGPRSSSLASARRSRPRLRAEDARSACPCPSASPSTARRLSCSASSRSNQIEELQASSSGFAARPRRVSLESSLRRRPSVGRARRLRAPRPLRLRRQGEGLLNIPRPRIAVRVAYGATMLPR